MEFNKIEIINLIKCKIVFCDKESIFISRKIKAASRLCCDIQQLLLVFSQMSNFYKASSVLEKEIVRQALQDLLCYL